MRLLKSVGGVDISRRTEVIADILDLLSLLADEFRQKSKAQTAFRSSKNAAGSRSYFNSFYESLVNHFRESREVRYYAGSYVFRQNTSAPSSSRRLALVPAIG